MAPIQSKLVYAKKGKLLAHFAEKVADAASDMVRSGLRQYHEDSVASFLWQGSASLCASLIPGCHVASQETDCKHTASSLLAFTGEKKDFPPKVLTDLICVTVTVARIRQTCEGCLIEGSGTQKAWAENNTKALV